MNNDVTGIVLCGGKSKRMGTDKGLLLYNGKELISYSIELLEEFCSNILISTNNFDGYSKFGRDLISDKFKKIGPLGGIHAGLLASKTRKNIVISCDMPFLSKEVFELALAKSDNHDIIVPVHSNGYFEPLAGYYSKSILPVIEDFIDRNDYKIINLIYGLDVDVIKVEDLEQGSRQFANMNSPHDLT